MLCTIPRHPGTFPKASPSSGALQNRAVVFLSGGIPAIAAKTFGRSPSSLPFSFQFLSTLRPTLIDSGRYLAAPSRVADRRRPVSSSFRRIPTTETTAQLRQPLATGTRSPSPAESQGTPRFPSIAVGRRRELAGGNPLFSAGEGSSGRAPFYLFAPRSARNGS